MGKYHPHGDLAVYDAMVRMAQDFSMRYAAGRRPGQFRLGRRRPARGHALHRGAPRQDRHGAARRSSTRTPSTSVPTTTRRREPVVLPARFPNLLVNGSAASPSAWRPTSRRTISARSIDGLLALMDKPDIALEELMEFVPGPDFPTGGFILGRAGIRRLRHRARLRSSCARKSRSRSCGKDREALIVTEIPYQVNKATLIEQIAELVNEKRIEGIADLRDESATATACASSSN
jgi:DNA gyrase subunit A